jgi:hypothetical protein
MRVQEIPEISRKISADDEAMMRAEPARSPQRVSSSGAAQFLFFFVDSDSAIHV